MAPSDIQDYLRLVPAARKAPRGSFRVSYDREADTAYVNFRETGRATDSEMTDDDVILRYDGDDVIGLTILRARERAIAAEGTTPDRLGESATRDRILTRAAEP